MTRVLVLVGLALGFWCTESAAGMNAGGQIRLSWDRAGIQTHLEETPRTSFPLYFHLPGVSDIRELAVALHWCPSDSLGEYYTILPGSADSTDGWMTAIPPSGPFDGDSSYTWSIIFPPGSDQRRIVSWFRSAAAETVPAAVFFVSSAFCKDSAGDIDTLQVVGQNTIAGTDSLALNASMPQSLQSSSQLKSRLASTIKASSHPGSAMSLVQSRSPIYSTARLTFVLPGAGETTLCVYAVDGRLVHRIPLGMLGPGHHTHELNLDAQPAGGIPAGVYFARLVQGAYQATVKLAVVR
jgi:hypothetical protein